MCLRCGQRRRITHIRMRSGGRQGRRIAGIGVLLRGFQRRGVAGIHLALVHRIHRVDTIGDVLHLGTARSIQGRGGMTCVVVLHAIGIACHPAVDGGQRRAHVVVAHPLDGVGRRSGDAADPRSAATQGMHDGGGIEHAAGNRRVQLAQVHRIGVLRAIGQVDDLVLAAGLAHGDGVIAIGNGLVSDRGAAFVQCLRGVAERTAVIAEAVIPAAECAAEETTGVIRVADGTAAEAACGIEVAHGIAETDAGGVLIAKRAGMFAIGMVAQTKRIARPTRRLVV